MGYIQLLATGAQDFNLIGNPQISFYKIVYRRYSNFSMDSKKIKLIGNKISNTDHVTLECDIKRDGDLLSNLYFTFELPEIFSGARNELSNTANSVPYEFRWVENIGTNIINNTKLFLNDSVINSYTGEYLQVMSELIYDDSKKKIYDEMTGNVPELYNPGLHNEINNKSKGEYYPIITNSGSKPAFVLENDPVGNMTKQEDTDNIYIYNVKNSINSSSIPTDIPSSSVIDGTQSQDQFNQKVSATVVSLYNWAMTSQNNHNNYHFYGQYDNNFGLYSGTMNGDSIHFKDGKIYTITNNLQDLNTTNNYLDEASYEAQVKLHYSHYPHIRGTADIPYVPVQHNMNSPLNSEVIYRHTERIPNTGVLIPSIKKRKIKVPLNFFFSKSSGLALPLIALQYTETRVEVKLNPLRDLYTILDYITSVNADGGKQVARVKPVIQDGSGVTINRFIENTTFDIKPALEAEYIYLDKDERNRFAINSHEYLIEDVFKPPTIKGVTSTKDHNIILHHPVKELIVVSQRSDMEYINNWNNYSNWTIEDVSPTSYRYHNIENAYYSQSLGNFYHYNKYTPSADEYKKEFFNKNIIENLQLIFNGQVRLDKKDADYFNLQQPYQHYKRKIKNGIHVYSFSLNPTDFQPSGACNFSRIDNFKMNIDLGLRQDVKEIPKKADNSFYYSYNFNIYAVHYNILKITSGLGAKQYVN